MASKSPKDIAAEPAIPFAQATESFHTAHIYHRGLNKRELFAGLAIVGAANDDLDSAEIAQRAVSAADALLAALAEGAGCTPTNPPRAAKRAVTRRAACSS